MRARASALVAGLLLLFPAAAIAQSAGDEQYSDPFGGNSPSAGTPTTQGSPSGSRSGSTSGSTSAPTGSSGQLAQTPSQTTGSQTSTDPSTSSSSSALPRTGSNAWLLAIMGGLMLLAGLLLRLAFRPLPRRVVTGAPPPILGRDVRLMQIRH